MSYYPQFMFNLRRSQFVQARGRGAARRRALPQGRFRAFCSRAHVLAVDSSGSATRIRLLPVSHAVLLPVPACALRRHKSRRRWQARQRPARPQRTPPLTARRTRGAHLGLRAADGARGARRAGVRQQPGRDRVLSPGAEPRDGAGRAGDAAADAAGVQPGRAAAARARPPPPGPPRPRPCACLLSAWSRRTARAPRRDPAPCPRFLCPLAVQHGRGAAIRAPRRAPAFRPLCPLAYSLDAPPQPARAAPPPRPALPARSLSARPSPVQCHVRGLV